ncbi:MAG: FAD-dependent oxidoreductase, partial [Schwartzia sp.]|nr:FAD-dependent oxidoreductase [Schwartzia sp. (in: firmicutes)]
MAAAGALVGPGGGEIRVAEAADGLGGDTVKYAGRKIPVLYDMDVCVIGGGPAGTAAAINAARNGALTVLVERGAALG